MGKLTDNASQAFKKRSRVHIPAFFTWAQYVALAMVPLIYLSYFVFNKPTQYTGTGDTIVLKSSENQGIHLIPSSTPINSPVNSGKFVTIKNSSGSKINIPLELYNASNNIALAYYTGNWSKVTIVGTAPNFNKIYPKAKVLNLISYTFSSDAAVMAASIDVDGNGTEDESIQFSLIIDNNVWSYQSDN